jgi:hypothetical protein
MSQSQRHPVRAVVSVFVVVIVLGGCTSSKSKTPKPSGARSSVLTTTAAAAANGTAEVTVGATKLTSKMACSASATAVRAVGDTGVSTITIVPTGPVLSVVVTTRAKTGGSTTWQAVNGLKNAAGHVVGSVKAEKKGTGYTGTATYVALRLDAKGAKVAVPDDTVTGTFTLSCPAAAK